MGRRSRRKGRGRPDMSGMQRRAQHSYEHREDSGKFASVFTEDPPFWECTKGEHELAIIPFFVDCDKNGPLRFPDSPLNAPFSDEELSSGSTWDYKLALWVHYDVGINSDAVVCLASVNKKCPICEERKRLMDEEGLDYTDEQVRALSRTKRVYYNVICFDSDKEFEKGIQVWDAPFKSIEGVLSKIATKRDRRTGEFAGKPYYQPDEGWNVFFERIGKGLNTEYDNIEVLQRRKEDEISDEEFDEYYNSSYDLEGLVRIRSYDEIYEMLHGASAAADVAEDEEEDDAPWDADDTGLDVGRRGLRGRGRRARSRHDEDDADTDDDNDTPTADTGRARSGRGKRPACFGVDNNLLDECEDCPEELYDECFRATKKRSSGRSGGRRK